MSEFKKVVKNYLRGQNYAELDYHKLKEDFFQAVTEFVLIKNRGNQTKSAKDLGMNRGTLRRILGRINKCTQNKK